MKVTQSSFVTDSSRVRELPNKKEFKVLGKRKRGDTVITK